MIAVKFRPVHITLAAGLTLTWSSKIDVPKYISTGVHQNILKSQTSFIIQENSGTNDKLNKAISNSIQFNSNSLLSQKGN